MRSAERAIFVQLDHSVFERVVATLPGEQLVHLPCPDAAFPVEPRPGDVLFSTAMGGAHVGRLAAAGVGWIHIAGTGIDQFPAADAGDAVITCSRGASAAPIAEYVLATMLAFAKDLPGAWVTEPPARWGVGHRLGELRGTTLGLIGLGAIGRAVATRALAFDMRVVAARNDTSIPAGIDGVAVAPLPDVLAAADHLVLAAPSTPATHHLVDAAALAAVKPGVHLVNVARGTLIDDGALLDALDAGIVARASLDVTEPEPLPAGHRYYTHPRVRLTPHISWSAPEIEQHWVSAFAANLQRYRDGRPLLDVVDVDRGY